MEDQHLPLSDSPSRVDEQKRLLKQVVDDATSTINTNTLTTRDVNGQPQTAAKGSSSRRFKSTSSSRTNASGANRKVTLEVPLQYEPSGFPGLTFRQSSLLAVQTSFPLFSPQQQRTKAHLYSQKTKLAQRAQLLLPDITCQLSAATTIRGQSGYTTGSMNLQCRWDHINSKTKIQNDNPSNTMKHQIIQRWNTTVHTGLGVSESDHHGSKHGRSNKGIRKDDIRNVHHSASRTTSNIIPLLSLNVGVTTNFSHHQSSSSSLSVNVQSIPSKKLLQLPINISNQHQMNISMSKGSKKPTTIDVRSTCVTTFDNGTTTLYQPSINASLSISPSALSKSTKASHHTTHGEISSKSDPSVVLQHWTINLGFNKMKNNLHPSIGFSFVTMIPNLIRSMWKSSPNTIASNKLLEFSLQWKGEQGWQVGGWWTHKKNSSSNKGGQSQPPIKIGVGVTINKKYKNETKSSKAPATTMIPSPFGILSWIFTWTEGDFTLRIPILVSSAESAKTVLFQQGMQIFYLSFLSTIIQDVIIHFFSPDVLINKETEEANEDDCIGARSHKIRQEATMQQRFMEKQAKHRTELEAKKNGLVIQRAIMYVQQHGNDEKNGALSFVFSKVEGNNSFDVTIPLQFWLSPNESKLLLYGKRSCMLGFYDLAKNMNRMISTDTPSTSVVDPESTSTNHVWIQYTYEGQSYEIIVNDDEEIELPNIQRSKKIEVTIPVE